MKNVFFIIVVSLFCDFIVGVQPVVATIPASLDGVGLQERRADVINQLKETYSVDIAKEEDDFNKLLNDRMKNFGFSGLRPLCMEVQQSYLLEKKMNEVNGSDKAALLRESLNKSRELCRLKKENENLKKAIADLNNNLFGKSAAKNQQNNVGNQQDTVESSGNSEFDAGKMLKDLASRKLREEVSSKIAATADCEKLQTFFCDIYTKNGSKDDSGYFKLMCAYKKFINDEDFDFNVVKSLSDEECQMVLKGIK